MKKKRRTKTAKSGRIARLRAAADELRRSPEMAEMYRPIKRPVTLRLDADVIAWFKAQGRGPGAARGNVGGEEELSVEAISVSLGTSAFVPES